jgi:AGZA family xanthine/uracil permease-like MFS transporter
VQKVPAAVFFGLLATAIIGLILTLFGFGAGDMLMPSIPNQIITLNMDTSLVGGFARGFGQLFTNIPNLIIMVFSLVFVTFFDTTGTLMTVGRQCGFVDKDGNAKGIEKAFLSDALAGIIGSVCGTSTVTAYIESATGIGIGGRTGLTAIVTGILFILSIFISPLILSLFTSSVTAAALVIVGILMVSQLREVNWNSLVISASVFMTIIIMILSYSISIGIAWGFLIYALGTIAKGRYKEMGLGIWILAIIFLLYLFFGL